MCILPKLGSFYKISKFEWTLVESFKHVDYVEPKTYVGSNKVTFFLELSIFTLCISAEGNR